MTNLPRYCAQPSSTFFAWALPVYLAWLATKRNASHRRAPRVGEVEAPDRHLSLQRYGEERLGPAPQQVLEAGRAEDGIQDEEREEEEEREEPEDPDVLEQEVGNVGMGDPPA